MPENLIKRFKDLSPKEMVAVRRQVEDIFFETSSRKEFPTDEEKRAFLYKYLGYYLDYFPDLVWVALEADVLGYIVAAPISDEHELLLLQPHLHKFKDLFNHFPAHLHINLTQKAQGKGLGSELVGCLENELKRLKIQGLHIMTGVQAENGHFYRKLGFLEEVSRDSILFMGKRLG